MSKQTTPLIIAHRGASFAAPENTVAAIQEAWKEGADGTEVDIYLTQDGRLVAIHDHTTQRTTNADLDVQSSTLEELTRLDAGSWKSPQWAGEPIPTLEAVLAAVPAGKILYIELKGGKEILPELKQVIDASGKPREEIILIDFKIENLIAAKAILPDIRKLWLEGARHVDPVTNAPIYPEMSEVVAKVKQAGLDGLDLHHGFPINKAIMDMLKSHGLTVAVWTIDQPAIAEQWAASGVDAITTNKPNFIRNHLSMFL
jgi:glycerophosphoryl diester phosphodiesterase